MYALILNWDLSEKPKAIFEQLRQYVADESWKRYKGKKGLVQKLWYSNSETGQFGGIYLWETKEAMEEEMRTIGIVCAFFTSDWLPPRLSHVMGINKDKNVIIK